eukprot:TRINITY_DN504_c1_g1_i6.p1 TRINITY_DN504_c1_g1~~TRINITY_DN504_c1_g1_i6.p1  ORF type:complete len:232 (+),score=90.45 TRINITY_DN504_c1_g1_i6:54-698(+)
MVMTFSYFGIMAKGFGPLMCLENHGLEWEGKAYTMDTWPEMKKSGVCPFGQLPILECDAGVVAQSAAIMQYVGRKVAGAGGACEKEIAVSDMLMGLSEDFWNAYSKVQPTLFVAKKVPLEEVAAFWATTIPEKLAYVESFLKGKDAFTSSGITVGELALWSVFHMMARITPEFLDKTPNTKAFYTRILNLPGTQKLITGKTSFGELPSYFIKAE